MLMFNFSLCFQLANIIWGEAGENDDHIVPYPEASDDYCNKKEWGQESHTIKPTEQKTPVAKIDLHSSSNFDTIEGISTSEFGTDSWPDLSLSDVAKTEQHCIGTEAHDNFTEIINSG